MNAVPINRHLSPGGVSLDKLVTRVLVPDSLGGMEDEDSGALASRCGFENQGCHRDLYDR